MSWPRLLWFDLSRGRWIALGVLKRRLGWLRLFRALLAFAWRNLRSPFRGLPRARSRAEAMSRFQMGPALVLDAVLRESLQLPAEEAASILRDVVAESGARFLAANVELKTRAEWEAMSAAEREALRRRTMARFFNMRAELVEDPAAELAFDVSFCHFASLAAELGRPSLARAFCAADSVFFEDPAVPFRLEREETLAGGAPRCAFRFSFREG